MATKSTYPKGLGVMAAVTLIISMGLGLQGRSHAAPEPKPHSPALKMFTEQLPVPPEIDARAGGSFGLNELVGTHQFGTLATGQPLGPTPSFGYWPSSFAAPGDVYLGPTIEAARDYPIAMTVTNKLSVPG